jgi:hypothetical protein
MKNKAPKEVMSGSDIKIPNQMGRPTKYCDEFVDEILERLSFGESLKKVCTSEHLPSSRTVWTWMRVHPEFLHRYEKAKEEACEAMAEELNDIAEDDSRDTQRSRLMIDTRKWYLSKIKAKKYGEKLDTTVTHKFSALADDELEARIKELENQTPE